MQANETDILYIINSEFTHPKQFLDLKKSLYLFKYQCIADLMWMDSLNTVHKTRAISFELVAEALASHFVNKSPEGQSKNNT